MVKIIVNQAFPGCAVKSKMAANLNLNFSSHKDYGVEASNVNFEVVLYYFLFF